MKSAKSAKKITNSKQSKIKYCTKCGTELTSENSKEYNIKYSKYICEECLQDKNKKRYDKNKEYISERCKKYEKNNKEKIIKEYGGKCVCCGESIPEFLTIDHINNNGAQCRKETNQGTGGKLYRWLIKNNYPKDNYQLLCFNCNCAKGFFGECPHKNKKGATQ